MLEVIEEISEYLSQFDCIEKVLLFGSRARKDNLPRSDIDLAIFGIISEDVKSDISIYFSEEVNTLLKIDFVFAQCLNKEDKFFANIIKEGVSIYERK